MFKVKPILNCSEPGCKNVALPSNTDGLCFSCLEARDKLRLQQLSNQFATRANQFSITRMPSAVVPAFPFPPVPPLDVPTALARMKSLDPTAAFLIETLLDRLTKTEEGLEPMLRHAYEMGLADGGS